MTPNDARGAPVPDATDANLSRTYALVLVVEVVVVASLYWLGRHFS